MGNEFCCKYAECGVVVIVILSKSNSVIDLDLLNIFAVRMSGSLREREPKTLKPLSLKRKVTVLK